MYEMFEFAEQVIRPFLTTENKHNELVVDNDALN